jgi:hypothetical protein
VSISNVLKFSQIKVIHPIKYTFRFSGSLILIILFSLSAFSQDQKSAAGKKVSTDSISHPVFISVGVDVSRLLFNVLSTPYKGGEVSLDVRNRSVLGDFHFGFGQHSKSLERYRAKSSGVYYGIGISKSLFLEESNVLAFGLRLAGSSFQYQPQNIQVPLFPTGYDLFNPQAGSCFAMWGELNAIVRTRLTGWIMMGFELRMKSKVFTKTEGFTPYFIPGYGLFKNAFSPGINYFIFVQIPNGTKRGGKTH